MCWSQDFKFSVTISWLFLRMGAQRPLDEAGWEPTSRAWWVSFLHHIIGSLKKCLLTDNWIEGEKSPHDAPPALLLVNTEKTTEKEESELALENSAQKRCRRVAVTPGGTMAAATAWVSPRHSGLKQRRLFLNALTQGGGAGRAFWVGVVLPYQARSSWVGNTLEWKICA